MKTYLQIKDMRCNSCKWLIEDVCKEASGVTSCRVDFATGQGEIEHDGSLNVEELKKEIESLGEYKVEVIPQ